MRNRYMKDVPDNLRDMKTGMNIVIYAHQNIANNAFFLKKAINEQTIHKARVIIAVGDYLAYEEDLILQRSDGTVNDKACKEALKLLKDADFYHIMCHAPDLPGWSWDDAFNKGRCNPNNTLIQYFGSVVRDNKDKLRYWHEMNGIKMLNYCDYSMLEGAGEAFYHIPLMYDAEPIELCDPPDDRVVVCHAPTHRLTKGTEIFLAVMKRLEKKYPVETLLIEGVTNAECMKLKRQAHICFDSVNEEQGLYGLTALESMAMGQPALCCINNFTRSFFPDCPVIPVVKQTLEETIAYYIERPDSCSEVGRVSREWVMRVHNPKRIIRQYAYLWDTIRYGTKNIRLDEAVLI